MTQVLRYFVSVLFPSCSSHPSVTSQGEFSPDWRVWWSTPHPGMPAWAGPRSPPAAAPSEGFAQPEWHSPVVENTCQDISRSKHTLRLVNRGSPNSQQWMEGQLHTYLPYQQASDIWLHLCAELCQVLPNTFLDKVSSTHGSRFKRGVAVPTYKTHNA